MSNEPDAPLDFAVQKLEAIREILRNFDWEHSDRQYALEQIDRIVEE